MEKTLGLEPLSDENRRVFEMIWKWFITKGITNREEPQVGSAELSGHLDGVIYINEAHSNEVFPVGAVILEEVLHYVLSSRNPATSADFSTKFLQRILRIIAKQLEAEPARAKREFQSLIVCYLWRLIEQTPV